jgi:5'(3')-deoxyribonucleotidase
MKKRPYKPLVLVDVDGVVADFVGATIRALGGGFKHDDVKDFNFVGTPDFDRVKAEAAWVSPGFVTNIPVLRYAIEGIMQLREISDVVFCTAPFEGAPCWVSERVRWLERHFGAAPEEIIFAKDKSLVVGDMLVDDKCANLDRPGSWLPVCWDQPWNRMYRGLRVTSWRGVRGLVEGVISRREQGLS